MAQYGPQLRHWLMQELATRGGRCKSIHLPAGSIGFRRRGPKLVIDDADALLAWAKEHAPQLVQVKEEVSKSKLNEHLAHTGEVPSTGVHLESDTQAFYVSN